MPPQARGDCMSPLLLITNPYMKTTRDIQAEAIKEGIAKLMESSRELIDYWRERAKAAEAVAK